MKSNLILPNIVLESLSKTMIRLKPEVLSKTHQEQFLLQ